MMMDIDQAAKAMRDEEMLAEIEDFLEGFNQPTYRGMRINGVRVPVWSSQRGMSGLYNRKSAMTALTNINAEVIVRLSKLPISEWTEKRRAARTSRGERNYADRSKFRLPP